MMQPTTLARIAGILYLTVGLFGGFAQGYFQPLLYVADDPAATYTQITTHAGLVPWGVLADLIQATAFVFLALVLQQLLRPFGEGRARAMLVLVIIAVAVMTLNNGFILGAKAVAVETSYATAFGPAGQQALVHLLLDLQHQGVLIAQVFFGLWLVPLGLLAWESNLFPRWLGALLVVGGACYLVNLTTLLVVPTVGEAIDAWIVIPCAAAEIAMVLYLLIFGVKKALSGRGPGQATPRTGSASEL